MACPTAGWRRCTPPRASFVSFLYGMLAVLGELAGVSCADAAESIRVMKRTRRIVTSDGANPARDLAEWLTGMPVGVLSVGV